MRNFKDVMKVSAVGAILLSALAACNSKSESNPTPPESDQVEVIIEQVVDGKVVDTRAVGRTDVVKYTGKTNGSDLVQLKWPGRVLKGEDVEITAYAKPNLYLQKIKYRYSQSESRKSSPTSTNVRGDTYNASRPLTAVNENSPVLIPTKDAKNNRVYVSLEYNKLEGEFSVGEPIAPLDVEFYEYEPRYTGDPWDDPEEDLYLNESLDYLANQEKYRQTKVYKDYMTCYNGNKECLTAELIYSFLIETYNYLCAQDTLAKKAKSINAWLCQDGDFDKEFSRIKGIISSGKWGAKWSEIYGTSNYYTEHIYITMTH